MHADLQTHFSKSNPGISADFSKMVVHGESAGWRLALLSELSRPAGAIKAVVAGYLSVETLPKRKRPILGAPVISESVLEEHLSSVTPGKVVTSALPLERMQIALSIVQQGRAAEFMGTDESLHPIGVIDGVDEMLLHLSSMGGMIAWFQLMGVSSSWTGSQRSSGRENRGVVWRADKSSMAASLCR